MKKTFTSVVAVSIMSSVSIAQTTNNVSKQPTTGATNAQTQIKGVNNIKLSNPNGTTNQKGTVTQKGINTKNLSNANTPPPNTSSGSGMIKAARPAGK